MAVILFTKSSKWVEGSNVEHLCNGTWLLGSVGLCPRHTQRGRSAPDVRPYDDERTRDRTEGVAKTGQVSNKGTVTHTDYWSGKLSVVARPNTVHVKLSEQDSFMDKWAWRNGRWIHRQSGTVLKWQTTAHGSASTVRLNSAVSRSLQQGGAPKSRNRNRGTVASPTNSEQRELSIETSTNPPLRRVGG